MSKAAGDQAKKPDWERIESEYRAGVLSVAEIARQFGSGISPQAIFKKAREKKWKRDLTDKVQRRARQQLVADVAVSVTIPTDEQIIEAAAAQQAGVIKIHRTDIANGRSLVALLSSQLQIAATARDTLEELIIAETEPTDPDGKPNINRRTAMMKAVSLPAHAGVIRDLSTALKNLVGLERQAFNVDDKAHNSDDPISAILDEVARRAAPMVRTGDD